MAKAEGLWAALYRAAVFEADKPMRLARISAAEEAIVVRVRELFHTAQVHPQERIALDGALNSLRALRTVSLQSQLSEPDDVIDDGG